MMRYTADVHSRKLFLRLEPVLLFRLHFAARCHQYFVAETNRLLMRMWSSCSCAETASSAKTRFRSRLVGVTVAANPLED